MKSAKEARDQDKQGGWAQMLHAGLRQQGQASQLPTAFLTDANRQFFLQEFCQWLHSIACSSIQRIRPHNKITFFRRNIIHLESLIAFSSSFFPWACRCLSLLCFFFYTRYRLFENYFVIFIVNVHFSHFRFSLLQKCWCANWCGALDSMSKTL